LPAPTLSDLTSSVPDSSSRPQPVRAIEATSASAPAVLSLVS
jgi:hypothetical protein